MVIARINSFQALACHVEVLVNQLINLLYRVTCLLCCCSTQTIRNTILCIATTSSIALGIELNKIEVSPCTNTESLTLYLIIKSLISLGSLFNTSDDLVGVQDPLVVDLPILLVVARTLIHITAPTQIGCLTPGIGNPGNIISFDITTEHKTRLTTKTLITRLLRYHLLMNTIQGNIEVIERGVDGGLRDSIRRNSVHIVACAAAHSKSHGCSQNDSRYFIVSHNSLLFN